MEDMEDMENTEKNKSSMNPMSVVIIFLLVLIIIILLCVGGSVLFAAIFGEEAVNQLKEKFLPEETTTISTQLVQERLNDVGLLVTQEYTFTQVESYEDNISLGGFVIPGTTSSCVFSYDGTIMAGVDFANIEVTIDDATKTVYVTVPPSKIISREIDPDSFQKYSQIDGFGTEIRIEDYNNLYGDLLDKAQTRAEEKGLYTQADENARGLVEDFLKQNTELDGYTFDIQTTDKDSSTK